MPEIRRKLISYHRAEYISVKAGTITLAGCLKQATDKLQKASQRVVERDNGQFVRMAMHKMDSFKGHYIHLTVDTPGEAASIVPLSDDSATEIQVDTAAPPDGSEFMDGDAFVYIRENHVLICSTVIRVGAVAQFLYRFFDQAKTRKDAGDFYLMNAPDVKQMTKILQIGVEKIELKASMYNATIAYGKRNGQVVKSLSDVSKVFKALFGKENDVTEDSLRVGISLRRDKRSRGLALGEERLDALARNLIQHEHEDDDFTIYLSNKNKIRPGQLFLREECEIKSKGKSVERDEAWEKLADYYEKLSSNGMLEV